MVNPLGYWYEITIVRNKTTTETKIVIVSMIVNATAVKT